MKDLIERQEAIDVIFNEPLYESGMKKRDADAVVPAIYEKIKSLPPAQPKIIRCKDCKYWQDQEKGVIEEPICARPENKHEKLPFRFFIGEDGFCSFAERRTDESD